MRQVLVVFFSRSGNTRRVARAIAEACDADLAEIEEDRPRRGLTGWLRSVIEARSGRRPTIRRLDKDPRRYSLVVVGGPVWAGRMASPVRSWLSSHGAALGRSALFVTEGGNGGESALKGMAALCAKPPDATLVVKAAQLRSGDAKAAVAEFVHRIRGEPAPVPKPKPTKRSPGGGRSRAGGPAATAR